MRQDKELTIHIRIHTLLLPLVLRQLNKVVDKGICLQSR